MNGNHTSEEVYIDDVRDVVRSKMDQKGLEFKDVAEHSRVDRLLRLNAIRPAAPSPSRLPKSLQRCSKSKRALPNTSRPFLSVPPIRSWPG